MSSFNLSMQKLTLKQMDACKKDRRADEWKRKNKSIFI